MRKDRSRRVPPPKARAGAGKNPRDAAVGPGSAASAASTFRALLERLDVGVANANLEGTLLYANACFSQMFGQSRAEDLGGRQLTDFIAASDWSALKAALFRGARGPAEGETKVGELGKGSLRTIRLSFAPLAERNGTSIGTIATEVTELVETAKALKQSEATLHSLSTRLLQAQDEERRRMARDLHDTTGQELCVAVMSLERLSKNLGAPGVDIRATLAECAEQLRKIETDVRTLSYVLHPPLLDEMGLRAALRWYAEGFSKRTGIQVRTEIPSSLPRLGIEKETALFRVIQESLTNVFRHSGSRQAFVRVSVGRSRIEASVEDEGKGFDAVGVATEPKPGVGIQSMRGRLEPLGGILEFRPRPRGTLVIATVPLAPEHASGQAEVATLLGEGQRFPISPSAVARKRILIADDHEVARQGIRALLRAQTDLEICGEAQDGLDAVTKAQELKPDLVIMDLSMPHMSGLSAATHIRNSGVGAKILMYTTHAYPQLEITARAAGCDGYVLKSNAVQDLIRGIRAVLQGNSFFNNAEQASRAHSA